MLKIGLFTFGGGYAMIALLENEFISKKKWMKKDECADCKYFRFCKGNGMHLRDENGDLLFCHLKRLQTP